MTDSTGQGWSFILPEADGSTPNITRAGDGSLTFEVAFDTAAAGKEVALSDVPTTAVETTNSMCGCIPTTRST